MNQAQLLAAAELPPGVTDGAGLMAHYTRRQNVRALFHLNRDRRVGQHYLDADTGVPHGPQRYMPLLMVSHVMNAVCAGFHVDKIDVCSDRRDRHVMPARLAYYFLARHLTTASFPRIARFCGNRDHTSAMSGHQKMAEVLAAAGVNIARDAALTDAAALLATLDIPIGKPPRAARPIINADWGKRV